MKEQTEKTYKPMEQRMKERHDGHYEWLRENHPETFKEQKHLDAGSPERAYWHHGYMMALRDIMNKKPIFPIDDNESYLESNK